MMSIGNMIRTERKLHKYVHGYDRNTRLGLADARPYFIHVTPKFEGIATYRCSGGFWLDSGRAHKERFIWRLHISCMSKKKNTVSRTPFVRKI